MFSVILYILKTDCWHSRSPLTLSIFFPLLLWRFVSSQLLCVHYLLRGSFTSDWHTESTVQRVYMCWKDIRCSKIQRFGSADPHCQFDEYIIYDFFAHLRVNLCSVIKQGCPTPSAYVVDKIACSLTWFSVTVNFSLRYLFLRKERSYIVHEFVHTSNFKTNRQVSINFSRASCHNL
jgi:hypothetical protein